MNGIGFLRDYAIPKRPTVVLVVEAQVLENDPGRGATVVRFFKTEIGEGFRPYGNGALHGVARTAIQGGHNERNGVDAFFLISEHRILVGRGVAGPQVPEVRVAELRLIVKGDRQVFAAGVNRRGVGGNGRIVDGY